MAKYNTDAPSLGHIQSKPLREQVLDMLHAAIVNGELKPGQLLVEADLAAQLGVSRAPLREAINILSTQGLVEIVPYHGTRVKSLSRKDIEELYSVRSLMEGFAIQSVIESGNTREVVRQLSEICAAMVTAADAGDLLSVTQLDRDFHDTLVEGSGNDLLQLLWNTVSLRVRQVMSLKNRRKGDLHYIARNHLVIVEVVESRDVEKAVALIHQHIGTTGDQIAATWEENGSFTPADGSDAPREMSLR